MSYSAAQLTLRPWSPNVFIVGTQPVPDLAGTRRLLVRGWLAHAVSRGRRAWRCPSTNVYGGGPANETSTQFRTRFLLPGGIRDVLRARQPGTVVLDCFRDDAVMGVSVAESMDNFNALTAALLALDAVVVVRTPTPRGDSNNTGFDAAGNGGLGLQKSFTGPQLTATFQLIGEMMKLRFSLPGVIIVDTWRDLADRSSGSGAAGFGYTNNGVQGNARWGWYDSLQMTEVFDSLYPKTFVPRLPSAADLWSVTSPEGSFIRNGFTVSGTNTNFGTDNSGQLSDNFAGNQTGNGIVLAFSKVTTSSFNGQDYKDGRVKNWLQIVVSGTATNTNEVCAMFQDIDPTLLVSGAILGATVEYELDTLVNLQRIKMSLVETDGGSTNTSRNNATQLSAAIDGQTEDGNRAIPLSGVSGGGLLEATKDAGVFRIEDTANIANTANKQIHLRLKTAATGAVSGTIRLGVFKGLQTIA